MPRKTITNVPVCHREREEGNSGYTLKKLLGLWFNGFTAFSVKPLRIATSLGVGFAGLGFLYGIYTIIKRLVNPNVPMGFSALMAALFFRRHDHDHAGTDRRICGTYLHQHE